MATNSRESRRRKIVDRGSDRFALITGRIKNLPSSPSSQSQFQHDSFTDSSPPSVSHDQDLPDHNTVSSDGENKTSAPLLRRLNPISDAGRTLLEASMESHLQSLGVSAEALKATALEASGMIQSSPVSSVDQSSSISSSSTVQQLEHRAFQPKLFTSNQISAAISTSERKRLLCSVVVALLVVLSHLGFPVLCSTIKDIVSFRPFFLLLLTNMIVVLVQLLLYSGGGSGRVIKGHDLVEQVGNALEIALLMQKVMDAVFMDFSVYVLIVICGLSFA